MRRTIAFVIALLILGAASAVGMAWFAAGVTVVATNDTVLLEWNVRGFESIIVDGWTAVYVESWNRRGWLLTHQNRGVTRPNRSEAPAPPRWSRMWRRGVEPDPRARQWLEAEFGWPMCWLYSSVEHPQYDRLADRQDLTEHGWAIEPVDLVPADWHWYRAIREPGAWDHATWMLDALPSGVRPLRGVVSIVAWSTIWLGVIAVARAPGRWRDRRRRQRGRCISCGHVVVPRGASVAAAPERCPECGRSIGTRRPFVTRKAIAATIVLAAIVIAGDAAWAAFLISRDDLPALHRAAVRGDVAAIDRELAANVPVDAQDRLGRTPLMYAAAAGKVDAVGRLLAVGADPNARLDRSVLEWAGAGGSVGVLEALVASGAEPGAVRRGGDNSSGEDALVGAIRGGHRDAVEWLLRHAREHVIKSSDWVSFKHTGTRGNWSIDAIVTAAGSADPMVLQLLLDAWESELGSKEALGAFLSEAAEWAIGWAARQGRLDNVRLLLARRDSSIPLTSPLLGYAAWAGHREIVLELLRAGAPTDCTGGAILSGVIHSGMMDLVEPLIAAGADPNCTDGDRVDPPLTIAVRYDEVECARRLIAAGARIGDDLWTRGSIVASINWSTTSDAMIDLLLGLLPDIDTPVDWSHRTMLMRAARDGSPRWVQRLLERRADPRAVDEKGWSVLDYAEATRPVLPVEEDGDPEDAPTRPVSSSERRAVIDLVRRAIERADSTPESR